MTRINERTCEALGSTLVDRLGEEDFCVLGCGGAGSVFAEMLARSGALKISLIDGDDVEETNLNRCFSFTTEDVGYKKTDVLEKRLKSINENIQIKNCAEHFLPDREDHISHALLKEANYIIVAADENTIRQACQDLIEKLPSPDRPDRLTISVSVQRKGENIYAKGEVLWNPNIPKDQITWKGYSGGSYISLLTEACTMAFNMLLCRLSVPKGKDKSKKHRKFSQQFPGPENTGFRS